jgi:hypothetical protein
MMTLAQLHAARLDEASISTADQIKHRNMSGSGFPDPTSQAAGRSANPFSLQRQIALTVSLCQAGKRFPGDLGFYSFRRFKK